MKKFKYLKISNTKKLRFIDNYYKNKLYIVFLPGFMSDIDGKKPQAFKQYAVKNKLGFLAIEYSGHGKSSGEFIKGNITRWTNDAKNAIKKIVKKNKHEIITKGLSVIKNGKYEYPITAQLIKDGRKNKILSKKLRSKIKVTMVHGVKDEVVPVSFSRKVLTVFPNAKKKLVEIKNGDHSLSNKIHLNRIIKELNSIVKNIV